ncbi:hypothetical protein JCM8097_002121 [Rhodosporidiobolus ruineniae]
MPSVSFSPTLSAAGTAKLRAYLAEAAKTLPAPFVEIGSPEGVLFSERDGRIDMLDANSPKPKKDSIYWFASTTKLITAVAALQLIDAGVLSLDTPMSKYFPQFAPPFEIIRSIDAATGEPTFETSNEEITVAQLMNQTSGFGLEMGEAVQGWKKWSGKAMGHTNTCKKDNLMPIPPTELPGRRFEYGNGSEWLGLLIQEATGSDLDAVFRSQIFDPLGMQSTTFYPFGEKQLPRLLPVRWLQRNEDGTTRWEKLERQCDLLNLPRTREEIEYPVAGGGIYTAPTDYLTLLRHLLSHHLSSSASSTLSLSADAINSLFKGTLPDTELGHSGMALFADKYGAKPSELDWSTGLCIFTYPRQSSGQRPLLNGGNGRSSGSAGWAGAPGIEYWADPVRKVAVVCGTQMLPGNDVAVDEFKQEVERLVYEALE